MSKQWISKVSKWLISNFVTRTLYPTKVGWRKSHVLSFLTQANFLTNDWLTSLELGYSVAKTVYIGQRY